MGRPKGSKNIPVEVKVAAKIAQIKEKRKLKGNFAKERAEQMLFKNDEVESKAIAAIKGEERDRMYFLGMLEAFDSRIRRTIDPNAMVDGNMTYTPIELYEMIYSLFYLSLSNCVPMTISGIGVYCGLSKGYINQFLKDMPKHPQYKFIEQCIDFVENYMEYMAQKKQNPAFQIFWLKNRGWKDKLEIEASSNAGALTEEERADAQRRIHGFSEVINK